MLCDLFQVVERGVLFHVWLGGERCVLCEVRCGGERGCVRWEVRCGGERGCSLRTGTKWIYFKLCRLMASNGRLRARNRIKMLQSVAVQQ